MPMISAPVFSWLGKSCLQYGPLPAIIVHRAYHSSSSTPRIEDLALLRPIRNQQTCSSQRTTCDCQCDRLLRPTAVFLASGGAGRPLLSSGTELSPAKYLPPKLSLLVTRCCHVEDRPSAVFSLSPILTSCQCAVS